MDPIDLSNIYNVYSTAGKDYHPQLMGRVVVTPTEMTVLADYSDVLQRLNGPITPKTLKLFQAWAHGSHSYVASLEDIRNGKHPDLVPEKKMPDMDQKPTADDNEKWFKVQRDDLDSPMMIRFKDGKGYQADSDEPMHPGELDRILDLVAQGKAVVRHHKPVEHMVDMLKSLEEKPAAEPNKELEQYLFQDPMLPGIRNRKDFQDHQMQPGTYIMLDGNDTGAINRVHGRKTGDDALKAYGTALRTSADDVLGKEHQDLWRLAKDHFMVRVPDQSHASRFLRSLRENLEKVVPVGGTHRLTMNAGLGSHPLSAKLALAEATKSKESGNHLPGSSPSYVHSLIPGSEGPVPVQPSIPKEPEEAPAAPKP